MPAISPQTRKLDSVYSKEEQEKAINECNKYLNDKSKSITSMSPISIYYIIKSLDEQEQINFIKINFDYIKQNDKDIFLYDIYRQPLCAFLSFKVIKEIYKLDKDIVYNMFETDLYTVLSKFKYEEILELYNDYPDIINRLSNYNFVELIYCHNNNLYGHFGRYTNEAKKTQVEFLKSILKKYKNRAYALDSSQFLVFCEQFSFGEFESFKEFVELNKDRISQCFSTLDYRVIIEFLADQNAPCIDLMLSIFSKELIKPGTKDFIIYISSVERLDILSQKVESFEISLSDWIKKSAERNLYNEVFEIKLNNYDVSKLTGLEELFDDEFYHKGVKDTRGLKYIEEKYRNSLNTNGTLFDIDENTSIFSFKYLKNLNELKLLLKNNSICKDSVVYQKHLKNFVIYIKNNYTIRELNNESVKEIEKLFYKIVRGTLMTTLYKINCIEDIVICNRLGDVEFDGNYFNIDQIKKYNVKEYKKLCSINPNFNKYYKTFILKLMFLVGYKHAKEILEIDSDITTLEHLVGSVDVKNVELDDQRNPILNKKIINLLFSDKDNTKIKKMLSNKTGELYEFFPRLFIEWEDIKESGKDRSLVEIIELIKNNVVEVPDEYSRLQGCFYYIGSSNDIVSETFKLHDEILERKATTIPKVSGKVGEYTYEILDLHDMYALTVGNRTHCCFTVKGVSRSSLKHACTSKNGRILVIKKDDELIAHSWLWRNGNLLCLDNIEVNKRIKEINFLDVYLDIADKIINKSLETEEKGIENFTIGHTSFDKPIVGIENYVSLVLENEQRKITNNMNRLKELPQPIEAIEGKLYTDSKLVQYLIRGNGNFKLGQSNYLYEEKQKDKVLTLSNKCC